MKTLAPGNYFVSALMIVLMLSANLMTDIIQPTIALASKPTKSNPVPTLNAKENIYTLNLNQLGIDNTIYLYGQDGRRAINFNVRANEVVSKATLKLHYRYSPDLLSEQSEINVYLNDESITTISISKENANKDLETTINLAPELFSTTNQITFQLVGHYALICEDPQSEKLWASIATQSELVIQSLPLLLPNDLGNFPIPFIDQYGSQKVVLPFVFSTQPNPLTLEAAGILSSWFGSMTNQTGTQFPVSIKTIPDSGNAIVFVDSPINFAGISLPSISDPTVFITSNPNDPTGKLLFVMGRNSSELKQAVLSLALNGKMPSGQTISLNAPRTVEARKPYDAPNWLNQNAPVKLADLNGTLNHALGQQETESYKLASNIQIPPALFSTNRDGIPIKLDYSYANEVSGRGTLLAIFYKTQYLKSLKLPIPWAWTTRLKTEVRSYAVKLGLLKPSEDLLTKKSTIHIPQTSIYPGAPKKWQVSSDQDNLAPFLRLDFAHPMKYVDGCPVISDTSTFETIINANSTIDISDMQHYIAMPNLAALRMSGFPFSRLADLSETAVVFSDQADLGDYAAYLAVLARIGRLTGYPATAVTVSDASHASALSNKDLLLITSGGESSALLKQWASQIPISNGASFKIPTQLSEFKDMFKARPSFDIYQNSFFAGFESPNKDNRSIVLISSTTPQELINLTNALDGSAGYMTGSLARLHEGKMELVSDRQTYHAGSLPWFDFALWLISEYVLVYLAISITGVIILALLIYAALKAIRKRRLLL